MITASKLSAKYLARSYVSKPSTQTPLLEIYVYHPVDDPQDIGRNC